MLRAAARKTLVTYLSESRVPAISEVGLAESEYARTKDAAFVTIYKDGKVVASSGRLHPKQDNTAKELMENALLCLRDPRIAGAVASVDDLARVRIRTDVLPASRRRVLQNVSELDIQKEGLVFLDQNNGKLSIILPNIANLVSRPQDLLSIAIRKAGLDPASVREGEYLIYGIQTESASEF